MNIESRQRCCSGKRLPCKRNSTGAAISYTASLMKTFAATTEAKQHDPPGLDLGQRAFEIVMARQMAARELETTWFERHRSKPITEIPGYWPDEYKRLVERRIAAIESNRDIALIERPEYKRRWNTEPWEEQEKRALKNWLLDRLEDAKILA